ncbi:hypothetical protein SRS16CHR_03583 [Variovorax sp. SRS16]|uniref:hypothetical protein n=1 Tax=Variovorax sp. SRS16 TaxID=282217 RepID=UPI0013163034|nr:hypothetical protein [Variovorax sp. SRS16]VTU25054.1 hypothetical protein SRS16CHR_03583 [Variovorax sp. SRS16]
MFAVLRATARHLGLADAGPVAALKPLAEHQPRINHATLDMTAFCAFARSPLTTADRLSANRIDEVVEILKNNSVQREAAAARATIVRAVEFACYRSLLNGAVASAGDSPTTEKVVLVLKRMAEDAEAALVEARADQAEHDRIVKARRDQLQPLRNAVSQRLGMLQAEFDTLSRQADSLRRPPPEQVTSAEERRLLLQAAGLSADQIAALNVGAVGPSREERRGQVQVRIAEVKALMRPLREFGETGDESVLAGIAEFEPLIAAQHAAEARE